MHGKLWTRINVNLTTPKKMILILTTQNILLARFILTGNSSIFFDTDGSIGWHYKCTKRNSPLKILDQCYDMIQQCLWTLSLNQNYPADVEGKSIRVYKKVFQLDFDKSNS